MNHIIIRRIKKPFVWGWRCKRRAMYGFIAVLSLCLLWHLWLYDLLYYDTYIFPWRRESFETDLVRDWLPVFIALVSLLFFPLWLDDKRTNLKWELQREHRERYWKCREDERIREQEAQREKWAAEHKQQESEIEESKQQRATERREREEQLRQWETENREWEERHRRENEESKRKAEARNIPEIRYESREFLDS